MSEDRGSAAARGYGARWRKARAYFLKLHPLCVACEILGLTTKASVVDHIVPHKGNADLFWARTNWQALCAPCHSGAKQSEERRGVVRGCDVLGNPIGRAW